ncbi:MAG: hypothetical protein M0R40_02425 [Firmicutes bacterium]|nr:hypothetical protein [Bacillota bacterium]
MDNYLQAYSRYHNAEGIEPQVIGKCENCMQILTDDYTVFTDSENNLFCSEECALKCYGVEEYNG